MRAFVEASQAAGLPHVADFNGATQHGVGPYPLNVVDGVRINTGMAYLNEAVRARPNLVIRGDAEADRVVFEGKRAVGVRLVNGELVSTPEVILSAGAFGSPAILMRSGIGPTTHLTSLGIATIADLPVGDRLQDHPFFYNVYALKPDAKAMTPAAGAIVWTRSARAAPGDLDLQIIGDALYRTEREPDRWRDRPRLRGDTVRSPSVNCALPAGTHESRHASTTTSSMTRSISIAWSKRWCYRARLPGPRRSRTSSIMKWRQARPSATERNSARTSLRTWRPTCTPRRACRWANDTDATAVVDAWGKVRGVDGLRVVDASILPDIPSVPTNVTTIMVAERIAAKFCA